MPKPVSPVSGSCETGYSDVIARLTITSSIMALVHFSTVFFYLALNICFVRLPFMNCILQNCRIFNIPKFEYMLITLIYRDTYIRIFIHGRLLLVVLKDISNLTEICIYVKLPMSPVTNKLCHPSFLRFDRNQFSILVTILSLSTT